MHSDVECYIATVVQGAPASTSRMDRIKAVTTNNTDLQTVKLINCWPEYKESATKDPSMHESEK